MSDLKPLRVALVHASDLGGGAERSVISLHRALCAAGHESTVFVGERRTDETGVVQIPYVRGIPGTRRLARALERGLGWQDIYNPSFRALESLLQGKFDVVHFNSLWGSSAYADLGALPAITRSVPGVITMRDEWLVTGHCACFHQCARWKVGCGSCPDLAIPPAILRDGTSFNWKRKRRAIQKSNVRIVAISEHLKRSAESSPILAGKKVTRIYNGIDLDVFRPLGVEERRIARARLGFDDSDRVVLIAGQTVEGIRQGIATRYAVAALNSLVDLGQAKALVVGHSAGKVAELIKIPSRTVGFQNSPCDMATLFQLADICLVTSEVEAFGRIAAEAQACGTPVVAIAAGGIPEVVKDGVGGILIPMADAEAVGCSLKKMVREDLNRCTMGRQGRDYVAERFCQHLVAAHYISLYRDIADAEGSCAA